MMGGGLISWGGGEGYNKKDPILFPKNIVCFFRLPTYNGKLMFVHSPENGEMWCSLMEKAYAKLFKSYVYLKGGQIGEALTDFTGGIAENIDLKKAPDNLYRKLLKANARQFLMGCAINAKR